MTVTFPKYLAPTYGENVLRIIFGNAFSYNQTLFSPGQMLCEIRSADLMEDFITAATAKSGS